MKRAGWVIWFFVFTLSLHAQTEQMSPEEIKLEQRAFALFKQEKYSEALPLFSQLLSLYPQEADYNYGYGVCMVELNRDIPKALKYLLYAQGESQNPVVIYYIGRCYHLLFRFEEAIARYNEFKRQALKTELVRYEIDRKIEMCNSGRELVRFISDLTVVDNKKILSENYYYSYDLKEFGGKLILKPAELKSKTDVKLEPKNSLAFLSKSTNQLFYASYDKLKNRDIYRVKVNKDGTFGVPENLGPYVNTPWEEDFPVLHADTVTLYFSSKGHNSMGGYDVFRSVLDSTTRQFSRPDNLDFPVNTPYDDYLYISDADDYYAYFASNRETAENKISVYKIIVDKNPIPRQFNNLEEIQQKSLLEISTADAIRKAEQNRTSGQSTTTSKPVAINQDNNKLKFTPVNYSPNVTQEQLVNEAIKDAEALKVQSDLYEKQAQQAYVIADNKNREAEEKRIKSAAITRDLYKYTDTEQQELKKEEAYQLIEEAEKLEKEAVTAFNLAKNLEKNNVEINKEIKRTENFKEAVSTSTSTVSVEALTESLNQNREKLNQAQNKYISPADEANSRLTEAEIKKKEYDYYLTENQKLESDLTNAESDLEKMEQDLAKANPEDKEQINAAIFDKQEEIADLRQKKSALAEPLEQSEQNYTTLVQEAEIYQQLTTSLSNENLTADATTLNKDELEKKIFDTELKIDATSANKNNNNTQNLTADNNRTTNSNQQNNTNADTLKTNPDTSKTADTSNQQLTADNTNNSNNNNNSNDNKNNTVKTQPSVRDSVNSLIEKRREQLAATQNPDERRKIEQEINDLEFLAQNTTTQQNNNNSNNTNPVNTNTTDNTNRTVHSDFSNTQTLPSRNNEISAPHSTYQQELLNARFFENLAGEQEKQLAVLNQMNTGDPSLEKTMQKQKDDLQKQIADNREKAKTSREKAKKQEESLTAAEKADTLSPVKFMTEGFDYSSGVEIKYTEAQTAQLDEIDEQKAILLTTQNQVAQKMKIYAELSVQKKQSKNEDRMADLEDQMIDIQEEITEINTTYKTDLKAGINNEYAFYNQQTESKKFHNEAVTKNAAMVEKEADLLHEKAVNTIENAEVIEDPVQRFKEYQKAAEINKLAVSKQKYAFELYMKAEQEAAALAANTTRQNDNPQVVKTTLGADEEELLKVYKKESGKADNMITQATEKLDEIKARREKADKTYSEDEKKKLLKGIDKEEQKVSQELLAGITKMSFADSNKFEAYRSQTQTMLNQQGGDETNKAIAKQYLRESEFFFNEAQKIKKEAQQDKNTSTRLEKMQKVNDMEKKAVTSQEMAVEVLTQPDPVLFVSTGSLTKVERLEAADQRVETDEVVKIRTDRIISRINITEEDRKNLDAATQKQEVADKLLQDADGFKKQIDSLKSVVNNPDANPKDRSSAQKKISPLEKKYLASIFSAAELSEQINDTRFYMYKEYIKPTRMNNNSNEDRQAKQLERDANTQYSRAKSMRDKSFITEDPNKAYGFLAQASEMEKKAIEDMERAFGVNLKLTPLEDEIREYAEKRKQRVAPEYEAYLVKTKTDITPIETSDTTLADNSSNNNQDSTQTTVQNDTRILTDNTNNTTQDTTQNTAQNDTRILSDNTNNTTQDTTQTTTQNDTRILSDNTNNTTQDTTQTTAQNDTRILSDNTNNTTQDTTQTTAQNDTRILSDNTNNTNNINNTNNTNNTSNTNTTQNNTGNQNSNRVVTPAGENRIFSVLPFNAYSAANPIPQNPPLPDGLIFKVQIGAFRNRVSDAAFGGLNPVNSETVAGSELIRYLVGLFQTSEAAFIARDQARTMGFRDAFVVAYMNGKRISIAEARKLAAGQPESEYLAKAAEESALLKNRTETTTTQTQNRNETQPVQNFNYASVSEKKDLFYTVQIGVYKSPVSPAELKNLNPIFEEQTQGFIRYTTGIFNSSEQATAEKNRIVQMGIPDAFVSAYYKGQKITLTEARKIQQGSGTTTSETTGVTYPEKTITAEEKPGYDKSAIVFKVQVGAYKEQVPVDMVNRFIAVARNQPLSQQQDGGTTYYMVGSFTGYDEAVKAKDAIINDGLKDAFVIAFAGGKKIPVTEALKVLND